MRTTPCMRVIPSWTFILRNNIKVLLPNWHVLEITLRILRPSSSPLSFTVPGTGNQRMTPARSGRNSLKHTATSLTWKRSNEVNATARMKGVKLKNTSRADSTHCNWHTMDKISIIKRYGSHTIHKEGEEKRRKWFKCVPANSPIQPSWQSLTRFNFPPHLLKSCYRRKQPVTWSPSLLCDGLIFSAEPIMTCQPHCHRNQVSLKMYLHLFPPSLCQDNMLQKILQLCIVNWYCKPIFFTQAHDILSNIHPQATHSDCWNNIPISRQRSRIKLRPKNRLFAALCLYVTHAVSFPELGNTWSGPECVTPAFLLSHIHTPPRQYQFGTQQSWGGLL